MGVSNRYLEGMRIVSGFWKVSGRYQKGLKKKFERCLEIFWNMNPRLISTERRGLICLSQSSTGQGLTGQVWTDQVGTG